MVSFLALLPRSLYTFFYAVAALLRFMAPIPPSPCPGSDLPPSNRASWRSVWAPRLWWLISDLSGTLSVKEDNKRLKQENEKLRNETEQIRKENERLAVLESKIDGLFSKYGISFKTTNKTDQS